MGKPNPTPAERTTPELIESQEHQQPNLFSEPSHPACRVYESEREARRSGPRKTRRLDGAPKDASVSPPVPKTQGTADSPVYCAAWSDLISFWVWHDLGFSLAQ